MGVTSRNPEGDRTLWYQVVMEAKGTVKRRLAPRGTPVPRPSSPYLVVPILGQSNAQGMGLGLDVTGPDSPHPRVHQWAMGGRSKGTVVAAVDPLLHEVPAKNTVGFGMTFAKELAERTGRYVLLIPGARGDTSFAPKHGYTWDPQNESTRVNLYLDACDAIDAVLAAYPGSELAAVLWHQGESDVPLTPAPEYRTKLDLVVSDLRRRYGQQLPFLIGQMSPEELERTDRDCAGINAVHADTPNRHDRAAFVETPWGCLNSAEDRHMNAVGQRTLGRSMWDAYSRMCADELSGYAVR